MMRVLTLERRHEGHELAHCVVRIPARLLPRVRSHGSAAGVGVFPLSEEPVAHRPAETLDEGDPVPRALIEDPGELYHQVGSGSSGRGN